MKTNKYAIKAAKGRADKREKEVPLSFVPKKKSVAYNAFKRVLVDIGVIKSTREEIPVSGQKKKTKQPEGNWKDVKRAFQDIEQTRKERKKEDAKNHHNWTDLKAILYKRKTDLTEYIKKNLN